MAEIEAKYGGRIEGGDPTEVYIALVNQKPIGFIQSYWIDDYPEHAKKVQREKAVGVDILIGELEYIGKGYGPATISQFVKKIIRPNYQGARLVTSDPEVQNHASVRAFEKAGFYKGNIMAGEYGPEQLMILEL